MFPGKFKTYGKWPKFGMAISQSIWVLWRLPLQYPTPHNLKILQVNYRNILIFATMANFILTVTVPGSQKT
jgi:hypothetical protein